MIGFIKFGKLKNYMKLPNDIEYNYTNFKILSELQAKEFNELYNTQDIEIQLVCFDSFNFMANINPQFGKSILTAKHWPKHGKDEEWSFYYDEYIDRDGDLYDRYHANMSIMKINFREYLHKYYNPEYVIDRDLTIIKTIRDLLDFRNITYDIRKPIKNEIRRKKHIQSNGCDWFDTGLHDDLIRSHPHAYVLEDI